MKLVDLIARELESWPEGETFITQDPDKEVRFHRPALDFYAEELAEDCDSDYGTEDGTRVTREMWQSARDKLKGETKVPKANKDGWIRHRGGKCPVAIGETVELRHREGKTTIHVAFDTDDEDEVWEHVGDEDDIMAYRIHAPEQAEKSIERRIIEAEQSALAAQANAEAKPIDGPLQWRDRIHTIDFDKASAQQAHDAAMAALDSERAELVAKLKAEGLALVKVEEDMSDPLKWKKGDVVVAIDDCEGRFSEGSQYVLRQDYNPELYSVRVEFDDAGSNTNGWGPSHFKWHSRPSKP